MDEFATIADLLAPLSRGAPEAYDLTDDAALLAVEVGHRLVVTKDMIVAGVHCLPDDEPALIARKLLRVNLSDLAAMGAEPRAYLLGLSLPKDTDDEWLRGFVAGLARDQEAFGISLIGGDTVSGEGPFTASLTAIGDVPSGSEIRRSTAQAGDLLFVSGSLGDAALGLATLTGALKGLERAAEDHLRDRYHLPRPRVALGLRLRGLARSMIDISDGLVADLGHLCAASGVAAVVDAPSIPLSAAARAALDADATLMTTILGGGDDYELLFSAAPTEVRSLSAIADDLGIPITRIGQFSEGDGVTVHDADGDSIALPSTGWRHF